MFKSEHAEAESIMKVILKTHAAKIPASALDHRDGVISIPDHYDIEQRVRSAQMAVLCFKSFPDTDIISLIMHGRFHMNMRLLINGKYRPQLSDASFLLPANLRYITFQIPSEDSEENGAK